MTAIAAVSCDARIADLEANGRLSTEAIRAALEVGAELIVLPELITSGYVFASREEAASLAIESDHPIFASWERELAGTRTTLVAGFCERAAGLLHNSAAVLTCDGLTAVYRKVHLWDREKLVFEPGAERPPVIETSAGRLGVLVCYDLEFPEMTRALALGGAEIIAVPTNWPLVTRPAGEHPPEVIAAMAAARSSRVFIACADRSGQERGVQFTGGTSVIDPDGWIAAAVDGPGMALADVDVEQARRKRIGPRNDVFADRNPDLYGDMLAYHARR